MPLFCVIFMFICLYFPLFLLIIYNKILINEQSTFCFGHLVWTQSLSAGKCIVMRDERDVQNRRKTLHCRWRHVQVWQKKAFQCKHRALQVVFCAQGALNSPTVGTHLCHNVHFSVLVVKDYVLCTVDNSFCFDRSWWRWINVFRPLFLDAKLTKHWRYVTLVLAKHKRYKH